jgi:hypothetical protein
MTADHHDRERWKHYFEPSHIKPQVAQALCGYTIYFLILLYFALKMYFKGEVKSVLRIVSAPNNVRTSNVNIAQISNVSNFSEHKLYFIFI